MRKLLLFILFLPTISHSASLAEQVQSLENQTAKADAQQRAGIKEIQTAVYGRYASSANITVGNPIVTSVNGKKARVRIGVGVHLPSGVMRDIHQVINKNIDARLEGDTIKYSFDDWCYTGKGSCPARLKTQASPAIWNELSNKALGIELSFMGRQQNGILIGQTAGDIGEASGASTFQFDFEVPKADLITNPRPKASIVLYRCKWHFSNPTYKRIKTF